MIITADCCVLQPVRDPASTHICSHFMVIMMEDFQTQVGFNVLCKQYYKKENNNTL